MKMRSVLSCCLLAILLSGCAEKLPPETTAAPTAAAPVYEKATVSFSEPQGEIYTTTNGWKAESDGVTYYFSAKISLADRNAVIQKTAEILADIRAKVNADALGCSIAMREDDYLPRVEENTLYIGLENFHRSDYAVGVAQMLFGNAMPYGLEYALGIRVSQSLGYAVDVPQVTLAEALSLTDTAPVYLDLNYPCFLETYADRETLPKVQAISLGLYDYLANSGKLDLYTSYSNETYRTYLGEFLAANGKEAYDNTDLDGTEFHNGGNCIRLVWENSDGAFYIHEGYTVKWLTPGYAEDMVSSSYPNLRKVVVDYMAQAAYMREALGLPGMPATVNFMRDSTAERSARGEYVEGQIRLYEVTVFPYVYALHLMEGQAPSLWTASCVAAYYSNYPVSQQITPDWYYDMEHTKALDDDLESAFFREIEERLGHPVDWYSMDDCVFQLNAYLARKGSDRELDSTGTRISFLHYLMGMVGQQQALQAFLAETPVETFGKSWSALESDWQKMMEDFAWAKEW